MFFWTLLLACVTPSPDPGAPACNTCHGDSGSMAPPGALGGATAISERGVGVHRAHLEAPRLAVPVACTDCHLVPATNDAPGHIDTPWPAEVTWGGLAALEGAESTWDPTTLTCTSYCHGSTLTGGTVPEPSWVEVADDFRSCQACHGFPPPSPHPQDTDCGACHSTSAGEGNPETHIDGILQVDATPCNACHGSGALGAPPAALNGAVDPSDPGVGQHTVHLAGTSLVDGGVPCADCHPVPATLDDGDHLDGTTNVVFGGDAALAGFSPSYDATTQTCTVYCHGAASTGGTATTPAWTDQQGGACNRCHGFSPPAPHPPDLDCERCHGEVVGPGATIVAPELHIDGTVQVVDSCDACHGTGALGAPPPALNGATAVTDPGVGQHAVHLAGTNLVDGGVPCADCHPVPVDLLDAPHLSGANDVVFGGDAALAGFLPSYDASTQTCTVYCHGSAAIGGTSSTPAWTDQQGGACNRCHGFPPPAPHPSGLQCQNCHGSVVGAGGAILAPALHINGVVDF
jgi:predicted CxxxxCH...CXXCH cytochrome family protein